MVAFAVLNPLPKKESGTSKELQTEEFLGVYSNALRAQTQGNLDHALALYESILQSDLMFEELNVSRLT